MNSTALRSAGLSLAFLPLVACGGNNSSVPKAVLAALAGATAAPKLAQSHATVQARLFIPTRSKTFASILRAGKTSSASTRKPNYVSYATSGIAIVSLDQNQKQIDSVAFSTSSSDNPNCVAVSNGTNCTFTIGADAPSTTFNVSAYDVEPSPATGGDASAEPPSANLLSTGSAMAVPITTGQLDAVDIALGGVATYVKLVSPNSAHPAFYSAAGTGASSFQISYLATDADGNIITAGANDPLASPVTATVSETNGTGHVTVANNTTLGGASASSSNTSDTFTVSYDGAGSGTTDANAYSAAIAGSTSGATDTVRGTTTNEADGTSVVFSPLFLASNLNSGDTFTAATSSMNAALAYTPPASPPYSQIDVIQNVTSNSTYAASLTTSSTCSGFSFATNAMPRDAGVAAAFDATSSGTVANGIPCTFAFSDGTSAVALDVSKPSAVIGISFNPASPASLDCTNPDGGFCGDVASSISDSSPNPTFTLTCTAVTNGDCIDSGESYLAYCGNTSGSVGVNTQGSYIDADAFVGNTGGSSSGNMSCTFTVDDGLGHTAPFVVNVTFATSSSSVKRIKSTRRTGLLTAPRFN